MEQKMITANLTVKQLRKLFKDFCKHKSEYKEDKSYPTVWQNCSDCFLRDIPWNQGHCRRDLCFAIWHEGILEREGE